MKALARFTAIFAVVLTLSFLVGTKIGITIGHAMYGHFPSDATYGASFEMDVSDDGRLISIPGNYFPIDGWYTRRYPHKTCVALQQDGRVTMGCIPEENEDNEERWAL